MRIGFIGLGNMGAPMAHNLLKSGVELWVHDLNAQAVDNLVEAGAHGAGLEALIAAQPQVVISMLPAAAHVLGLYLGEDALLGRLTQPTLLIDSSTIDIHSCRALHEKAIEAGHRLLDAPVSGGTGGAAAGTLTFMVGGSTDDFIHAQPLLEVMGKNIVHCGGAGSGQAAKVANNMLLGISMIATAEAMNLGVALGVDPKVLAGVINSSSGRCWSSDTYNPFPGVLDSAPAARGYSGGFASTLMLKDLALATDAARQAGQSVLLGAAAQQLYQSFVAHGNGALDFSAILHLYRTESACDE